MANIAVATSSSQLERREAAARFHRRFLPALAACRGAYTLRSMNLRSGSYQLPCLFEESQARI